MRSKVLKSSSSRRVKQSERPSLSSSILVAVDPHVDRFAAAVFLFGKLSEVSTLSLRELDGLLSSWECLPQREITILCEDQFVGRSFFTVKSLVRAAGQVQALAILRQHRFELVNPATWQKQYPLPKKREDRDGMLYRLAESIPGGQISNVDEACAVLMGFWRLYA